VTKYISTFNDGSPSLETGELDDDADAVAFAKVVAEELGRETQCLAPSVTVLGDNDEAVTAKNLPLICPRCSHEERLSGIERHRTELCFTFVCEDCGTTEVRTVSPVQRQ
jgi:hypothetical protein